MMRFITTAVVVSLLAIGIFSYHSAKLPEITVSSPTSSPTPTPKRQLHPLSIESLKARSYVPGPLQIHQTIDASTQVVSYQSDGTQLFALMITPSGPAPASGWPVIIVNHGYIPPQEYSVTRSYINTSRYFASRGFLVLKPDYRGHDRSEGVSSGRLFSRSEYTVDVLHLLTAVNTLKDANPNRIFMYGHSMGGEITLQIMEATNQLTAATLWAPAVTSLPEQVTHFMNRRRPTPGQAEDFKTQYENFIKDYPVSQISSIDNLSLITAPLNLHHGTLDESVPYNWGVVLDKKLKLAGMTVNFYSYPGDNHDIASNFGRALARDVEFFTSFLK